MKKLKTWNILDFPDIIYVKLKDNYRKKLFNQLYNKLGSKRKTAKFLGTNLRTLLNYERGFSIKHKIKHPQAIPIKILRKIINPKNQYKLEKNISYISVRNGLKLDNPKLPIKESPELYSISAHIIGDGSASKGKTPYYANTCKELRNQVINNLQILGNVNTYERIPNTTPLVYFPKVITEILSNILDIKFTYPNRIPKQIFKTTKKCQKAFLQALFDDEGTISSTLSIYIHNENLLNQLKQLLEVFNIKTGKILKSNYETKKGIRCKMSFIISTKSYENFKKEINFSHPDKIKNLEFAIRTKNRKQRTRDPIIIKEEILKLLKIKSLKTLDIANYLFFRIPQTSFYLNELEKEKLITKEGLKNKIIWSLKDASTSLPNSYNLPRHQQPQLTNSF